MLMHQTMRWFGPEDPVTLSDIRQAGCAGVVTALHQVPVGEVWTHEAIHERKALVEAAGMTWTVVESLPVSEDIKKRTGHYQIHLEHYKESLLNLAACGIKVVTYNFMPVLDWMRTHLSYELPDGSRALYFDRSAFIAFDIWLLKRPGAELDYTQNEIDKAATSLAAMTASEKETLFQNALRGLPGSEEQFSLEQIHTAIADYSDINEVLYRDHLIAFLREVIPVAEAAGIVLAIHPDDPPYSLLGLPRVLSTAEDVRAIITAVPSLANGLCFCTGSFGVRAENDIVAMIREFGERIHFLHLRNTKRDEAGNFIESNHLEGDTDMVAVIREVLAIQQQRNISIPMRPDHGHQLLDDLRKTTNPGYSAIGRLKGLAELRGAEAALYQTIYRK
jgi:mannonate dehydratase